MGAPAKRIELTEEEASTLKMLASAGTTEQRTAIRARVVLAAAQGMTLPEIARHTGLSVNSCLKWRKRFAEIRLEGLVDNLPSRKNLTMNWENSNKTSKVV